MGQPLIIQGVAQSWPPSIGNPRIKDCIGGPVHPLIRIHPATGEEAIYLNCACACYITDDESGTVLDFTQSQALITELVLDVCSAPLVYAHKWQVSFILNIPTTHPPPD